MDIIEINDENIDVLVQILHMIENFGLTGENLSLDEESVFFRNDETSGPLLYLGCMTENFELVDEILNLGGNPTFFRNGKKDLIQFAAELGKVKIIERLLHAGVDIGDDTEGTALYHACSKGHIDVIDYLIEHGADVNYCMKSASCCGTALMVACRETQVDAVQRLLDVGADVNIISTYGHNALTNACSGGSTEIFDKLIIYGAIIDDPKCPQTPLVAASGNGHIKIVQKLINLGVNVDQQNIMQGTTALMAAVAGGHTEIVKLLLDEDADMELVDEAGNDVYDMRFNAIYINHEIVTLLDKHRIAKLIDECD